MGIQRLPVGLWYHFFYDGDWWLKWFLLREVTSFQLPLLAALFCNRKKSCQLIGQRVLLSSPQKVWRLSRLAGLWRVNKERTEFDGQSGPNQPDSPHPLQAGVIDPPAGGMHIQRLRAERDGKLLPSAAEGQQLLISSKSPRASRALQQVCENHGPVVAAQEVPLPAAHRQEGEVLLITPALVWPQPAEEED